MKKHWKCPICTSKGIAEGLKRALKAVEGLDSWDTLAAEAVIHEQIEKVNKEKQGL